MISAVAWNQTLIYIWLLENAALNGWLRVTVDIPIHADFLDFDWDDSDGNDDDAIKWIHDVI